MANFIGLSHFNNSTRGADAAALMLQTSPLLNLMDAYSGFELSSQTDTWQPYSDAETIKARAIGGGYTAAAMTPETLVTSTLYMLGDSLKVDISHIRDSENGRIGRENWFFSALKRKIKAYAKNLEIKLIQGSGTGSPVEFKGLKTILDGTNAIPGYSGVTRVINAKDYSYTSSPVSLDLSPGNADYAENVLGFWRMFYNAITEMDSAKVVLCNATVNAFIQEIARIEKKLDYTNLSAFGNPVPTINGVPIITLNDGAITDDEADDTSGTALENTTSIYFMNPGEYQTSLITNSGLEYWEFPIMEATESGEEKWEFRGAWKIEEPKSVLRLRNIKIV